MNRLRILASVFSVLLAASLPMANAQSVTGQISGVVVDPAGAVVPGADVQLIHDLSQTIHRFVSEPNGSFIFTGLVPGTYSLKVSRPGFKAFDSRGITVATQERVDLHEIHLQVGEISSTISVQADAVHVATDSSDRSVDINLAQIVDTPTRGRNPISLIMTLPGTQSLAQSYDYRGWNGGGIPGVNGGQQGQIILNMDGAASQDSGNLNTGYISPSVDAIGEVKLLVSNYTAEYGGRTAGQMTLSTKNGTAQFHGSGYDYYRHESLNANEFFNNKTNVQRPRYRYQNFGGTIGGPLIVPGTNFNKSRQKLFFFFSYDKLYNSTTSFATYTMPTQLEKAGDFSKTVTTTGALIPIIDPNTQAPFPGNVIPASRISAQGQAMMNLFPNPSPLGLALDPTGNRGYNFRYPQQQLRPLDDKILRVDYNLSSKVQSFVRLLQDYQAQNGYNVTVGPPGGAWGQFPASYHVQSAGALGTLVYTVNPTLINEFSWGINRGKQGVDPLTDASSNPNDGGVRTYPQSLLPLKDANGNALTLPRINPASANTLNLLPAVNFGLPSGFSAQSSGQGVNAAPTFSLDSRWPFTGTDQLQTIQDKITWVRGAHTLKAGFYIEKMARNVSVYSVYNTAGTYYFGTDRANPLDTNYPYANAMLGSIFAYGDDNTKLVNHARYTQVEWYLQDTWKASRRLTIDYGARFYRVGDLNSVGANLGLFNAASYNPSQVGQLLYPGCSVAVTTTTCPAADKIAINPKTGAVFPYVRQGTFDASSYAANSLPYSGIKYYNTHFWNVAPIQVSPRIGAAWDVFGDGKTALRGGFGITTGRNWTVDYIGALSAGQGPMMVPPTFLAPTIVYTNFQNLTGSQSVYTPQNLIGGTPNEIPQATYNWSIGIQRELPFHLIADISYVGNALRNGYGEMYDGNAVAPLTTWKPSGCAVPIQGGCPQAQFIDPTTNPANPGFYSTNLIRALTGYAGVGNIIEFTNSYTNNYNSLQMQLNRRYGRLQWNLNYTFSRTIVYNNDSNTTLYQFVNAELTKNVVNRPHAVNFNFGYDIPDVTRGSFLSNRVGKAILDGWHINGNGSIFSGTPYTVGCSATGQPSQYWTGTPTADMPFRCEMGSNIFLPSGQLPSATEDPRLQVPLNAANFTLPPANSLGIGNTPPTLFYGPWLWTVDLSLAKMTRIAEGKTLELRVESFNTFNHFNPSNPNTSLTLNFATGANTNAAFGTIQGAQVQARHLALSARFRF
ncbi:MAG TPA: carboxypeptidase-like regulatory domain-containing protein [Bryobacteraceae bacterium]|nr:carboxypeptidase-like regulatory domain-containing protein [Bryobacteraceae bacterium]